MTKDSKLASYQAKQQILERRRERAPRDNRIAIIASVAAVALAAGGQFVYFNFGPGYVEEVIAEPAPENTSEEPQAEPESPQNSELVPSPELAEGRSWVSSLDLNGSPVELELFGDLAPQAVANYLALVQSGFYEGVNCHRLVTSGIYVLQCGDPDGNGTGGPGYNWGPIENAPSADLYEAGTLAMARRGGDGFSMGSQFFIVYEDSVIPSDQAGGYTIFGRVTAGLEAVQSIAAAGVAGGASDGSPVEPVLMTNLTIE
jgi:peptidyl-prolyl cis-trans isomerase B (cyclophilin B)